MLYFHDRPYFRSYIFQLPFTITWHLVQYFHQSQILCFIFIHVTNATPKENLQNLQYWTVKFISLSHISPHRVSVHLQFSTSPSEHSIAATAAALRRVAPRRTAPGAASLLLLVGFSVIFSFAGKLDYYARSSHTSETRFRENRVFSRPSTI